MSVKNIQLSLKKWYINNQRPLPWRQTKDPYLIWISEVMLQQTTVQAVIPYFIRFKDRFPTIEKLAQSPLEDVLSYWAGLGYYSRARNLHKASIQLSLLKKFPTNYKELLSLPGFGEYTSRAVSSIAFEEAVGVLDGNVIRILTRLFGWSIPWWQPKEREKLQKMADQLVQGEKASVINQAMMELGATICTPTSPACTICPWLTHCEANKSKLISALPLKKEKKPHVFMELEMNIIRYKDQIALEKAFHLPFLKNSFLPPLKSKKITAKPKKYDFQHSITHYKIFVKVKTKILKKQNDEFQWYPLETISKVNPSSILKKALIVHPDKY